MGRRAIGRMALVMMLAGTVIAGADPADRIAPGDPELVLDDGGEPQDRARQLFYRGRRNLQDGKYRRALALFTRAFEEYPETEIHYFVAEAHRRLGSCADAVPAYRRFLLEHEAVEPSSRAEANMRIEACGGEPVHAVLASNIPEKPEPRFSAGRFTLQILGGAAMGFGGGVAGFATKSMPVAYLGAVFGFGTGVYVVGVGRSRRSASAPATIGLAALGGLIGLAGAAYLDGTINQSTAVESLAVTAIVGAPIVGAFVGFYATRRDPAPPHVGSVVSVAGGDVAPGIPIPVYDPRSRATVVPLIGGTF